MVSAAIFLRNRADGVPSVLFCSFGGGLAAMFNAHFGLVSLRIKGDVYVQASSLSSSFSLVLVFLTESSVLASLKI